MKFLLTSLAFVISTACFAQIKTKDVVGVWTGKDLTVQKNNASPGTLSIDLRDNTRFEVSGKNYLVSGSWELKDSILIMNGLRSDQSGVVVEKLIIRDLTKSERGATMVIETDDKVVMNLARQD